mmetsp:Transcript_35863/g.90893  ORF Transcript_35863/g.90893 Transcript_35863/m.90893 type:complete len:377 (-) Transcript_35863:958-2088(-)
MRRGQARPVGAGPHRQLGAAAARRHARARRQRHALRRRRLVRRLPHRRAAQGRLALHVRRARQRRARPRACWRRRRVGGHAPHRLHHARPGRHALRQHGARLGRVGGRAAQPRAHEQGAVRLGRGQLGAARHGRRQQGQERAHLHQGGGAPGRAVRRRRGLGALAAAHRRRQRLPVRPAGPLVHEPAPAGAGPRPQLGHAHRVDLGGARLLTRGRQGRRAVGVGRHRAERRAGAGREGRQQGEERAHRHADRDARRPAHHAGGRGARAHGRAGRLESLDGLGHGGAIGGALRLGVAASGGAQRRVRRVQGGGQRGRPADLLRLVQQWLPPRVPRPQAHQHPGGGLDLLQLQARALLVVQRVRHAGRAERDARTVRD